MILFLKNQFVLIIDLFYLVFDWLKSFASRHVFLVSFCACEIAVSSLLIPSIHASALRPIRAAHKNSLDPLLEAVLTVYLHHVYNKDMRRIPRFADRFRDNIQLQRYLQEQVPKVEIDQIKHGILRLVHEQGGRIDMRNPGAAWKLSPNLSAGSPVVVPGGSNAADQKRILDLESFIAHLRVQLQRADHKSRAQDDTIARYGEELAKRDLRIQEYEKAIADWRVWGAERRKEIDDLGVFVENQGELIRQKDATIAEYYARLGELQRYKDAMEPWGRTADNEIRRLRAEVASLSNLIDALSQRDWELSDRIKGALSQPALRHVDQAPLGINIGELIAAYQAALRSNPRPGPRPRPRLPDGPPPPDRPSGPPGPPLDPPGRGGDTPRPPFPGVSEELGEHVAPQGAGRLRRDLAFQIWNHVHLDLTKSKLPHLRPYLEKLRGRTNHTQRVADIDEWFDIQAYLNAGGRNDSHDLLAFKQAINSYFHPTGGKPSAANNNPRHPYHFLRMDKRHPFLPQR